MTLNRRYPIEVGAGSALVLALLSFCALPARAAEGAFTCPAPEALTTSSAIQETPADVADVTSALAGPERENAILVVADKLKKAHPRATKDEVINYMLTAYCPLVAKDTGLSQSEKRGRMDRFASQVRKMLR